MNLFSISVKHLKQHLLIANTFTVTNHHTFFIFVPCIFYNVKIFTNKCNSYLIYKILKFTLKHFFTVTLTYFGPCRPSSRSLY